MTEHELAQEAMSAKLDGVISPAEEARLEAHLTACPDCAALFETMREMQGLFALDFEPPEELVPAVMEKIREDAPAKKRGKVLWLRWASLAAALALVTFAGLRLMRDGGLTGGFSESAEFTAPMAAAPAEESVLFSEEAEALPEAGLKMSLMTAPAENGAPLEDALRALETAPEAAEEPAVFNSDTNLSADVPGPEPKQEAEHASAEETQTATAPTEAPAEASEPEPETPPDEAPAPADDAPGEASAGPRLILFYDPAEADIPALLEAYDLTLLYDYSTMDGICVRLPEELNEKKLTLLLEKLAQEPGILSVQRDEMTPLDPPVLETQ